MEVSDFHVTTAAAVLPIVMSGVESEIPKLRPVAVSALPLVGPEAGLSRVKTGPSYEKIVTAAPVCPAMTTAAAFAFPTFPATLHDRLESEVHVDVRQFLPSIEAVGPGSSTPKLRPVNVTAMDPAA
eukprot:1824630-Rhodomonas_salina.1